MRILKLIFLSLCILSFTSCKQIEVGNIQNFALKSFSGRSISIDVQVEISNPKLVAATITNGEFEILAGDRLLGTAVLQNEVRIKRRTSDAYYFPIELKLADDISSYFSIIKILKKSSGPIRMKGWIDGKSGIVSKRFDFEKEIEKDQIPFL